MHASFLLTKGEIYGLIKKENAGKTYTLALPLAKAAATRHNPHSGWIGLDITWLICSAVCIVRSKGLAYIVGPKLIPISTSRLAVALACAIPCSVRGGSYQGYFSSSSKYVLPLTSSILCACLMTHRFTTRSMPAILLFAIEDLPKIPWSFLEISWKIVFHTHWVNEHYGVQCAKTTHFCEATNWTRHLRTGCGNKFFSNSLHFLWGEGEREAWEELWRNRINRFWNCQLTLFFFDFFLELETQTYQNDIL